MIVPRSTVFSIQTNSLQQHCFLKFTETPKVCPLNCLRACKSAWDEAHKGSWDHSSACHIAANFLLLEAGH